MPSCNKPLPEPMLTQICPAIRRYQVTMCWYINGSKDNFPALTLIHDSLQWRHHGQDSVSNNQPHDCLLNHSFRRRSKKTSKLRFTGLCVGNSPGTGEFPTQMTSNAENVSIWWRYHVRSSSLSVKKIFGLLTFFKAKSVSFLLFA